MVARPWWPTRGNRADIPLSKGSHKGGIADGGCVMEMTAYVAGEPWSDAPQCACPVLTAVLAEVYRPKPKTSKKKGRR